MYCPRCGEMLQAGARFCSACGENIGSRISGSARVYRQAPASKPDAGTGPRFVKFMAAAAIVVLFFAFALYPDDPSAVEPERSITIGDMTLYGDISDSGCLTVDGATIAYTGASDAVEWSVRTLSAEAMVPVSGHYEIRGYTYYEGRSLTLSEPGNYRVALTVDGSEECSGRVVLDGAIRESYSWVGFTSSGSRCSYSAEFEYSFSDYYEYAAMPGAVREYSYGLDDSRFVVVDDTILGLEKALRAEFVRVNGDIGGSAYADYLLSFVQCIIKYPTQVSSRGGSIYYLDEDDGYGDLYLFGQEEYWAYPMETLYFRQGDCEDTAFLACALFSAAGYKSGTVSIPEHMMAAICLDSISPYVYSAYYDSSHLVLKATQERVYFCETTYESAVPAGYYSKSNHKDLMEVTSIDIVPPYEREDEV